MQIKLLLATSVTSLIVAAVSVADSVSSSTVAMNELRAEHPSLRTMDHFGKVHKLYDKELASGSSPLATAEAFINKWSRALDVQADEFVQRGPFPDQHVEQQLMYDKALGQHKFTGVYYMQTADGLPVYGTRLMVLVRNADGFPAVSATTDLRDVKGYKSPQRLIQSEAIALMAAATRLGKGTTITEPELMVYAGSEEEHHEPTAALVFQATQGGNWDFDSYKKFELIVNAQTGEILHENNLILHVDGNVSGMATESSGADVCEPESSAGMPYARVTLGGNSANADANGDFTISGSGTITSTLDGLWFNVNNQSGSDVSLSQNSSDPYFMHNEANNSEGVRAQVNAYMHSNVVRDFTLEYAPAFPTIGNQYGFPVNTGVSGTCNAYYDYSSINFYNSGGGCSNTAFSVIVHHEYGHHLVAVAGSGQGQYGEGMGDVMGVLITGDNQLARGFYSNDCVNGIRNAINNHQYPCSGGIHDCGQLISGCVWDALAAMEASYPGQGLGIISTLAVNSIMMHAGGSIDPTITMDWLTLDDDDGDLSNGTPHSEQILIGFGMHNMDELPEPLDNDFCSTARYVTDGDWSFTNVGALSDGDAYNDAQCTGTYLGVMASDVWFSYIACENGSMTVSTCDLISFDSDIVIYEGTCDSMTQVACNGDGDACGGYSSIVTFNVNEGANYLIRVGGWDSSSQGSGTLFVDGPGTGCETDPVLVITYPDGRPDLVDPNGGTTVAIDVAAGTSEPSTGQLHWNDGSGWNSAPLNATYDATFPAFDCGASVDWYVSVDSVDGETVYSPNGAPSNNWNAMAYSGSEITFDDDFQTDMGWTVDASAGTGNWTRVTPSGGGVRCDAPTDADGSGMCYVTGNGADEDVDDGTTTLTSPVMEFTDGSILSYSRWYNNGASCNGADPNNDYFYVDVSINGGAWTNLETVGPVAESSGGWYNVENVLSGSGSIAVRFVCGDVGAGSIIEAGVDAVSIKSSYCDEVSCAADINGDNMVDVTDLLEVVGAWGNAGGPADVNGDGIVNVADLLAVVDAWGPCEMP